MINLKPDKIKRKQLIAILVLIFAFIGIAVGTYLVQQRQILKIRGTDRQINETVKILSADGQESVSCSDNGCDTDSLDLKMTIDISELERLVNQD